eukprot:s9159_g1.t1
MAPWSLPTTPACTLTTGLLSSGACGSRSAIVSFSAVTAAIPSRHWAATGAETLSCPRGTVCYIDVQELADIKFGGELPVLEEHLAHMPRSMALLVNLDRLPNLGLAEAASKLDSQSMSIALAGQKHVWWHHDASECCRPPQAVNGPLELCIQTCVKEHQAWQRSIADRGDKGLTAKQQAKYDRWCAQPLRQFTLPVDASGAKSTHGGPVGHPRQG